MNCNDMDEMKHWKNINNIKILKICETIFLFYIYKLTTQDR